MLDIPASTMQEAETQILKNPGLRNRYEAMPDMLSRNRLPRDQHSQYLSPEDLRP